jgi:hypothetical protein
MAKLLDVGRRVDARQLLVRCIAKRQRKVLGPAGVLRLLEPCAYRKQPLPPLRVVGRCHVLQKELVIRKGDGRGDGPAVARATGRITG